MVRARQRIRELTCWKRTFVPISQLIAEVNRFLKGWRGYFGHGHPRKSFDRLNW
jgi:Group II intron, maturase-specific domain